MYLDLTREGERSVCGNKLIFKGRITVNFSLNSKLAKAKAYVLKNDTPNLFGTDWIELFSLRNLLAISIL